MARAYDNWERLVAATLDRERLRELALASSMETSFSSSITPRFHSTFSFKFRSSLNHDPGGLYFLKAILLADEVVRVSESTTSFKQECLEIKSKARKVASLLRQWAPGNHELYDRPTRWVMDVTENVLRKAISLVLNCRRLKRVLAGVTSTTLQDISSQLDYSIGNICWLLRDDDYYGVPPIAADEPDLYNIWELIAILHTGSNEDQSNAVDSIVSLAHQSDTYRKLIIEEGGIEALLRLVQEGTSKVQENALMVIVLLGKENWRAMDDMVSSVFVSILKQSPIAELQGTVAWAVSELAETLCDYERYNFVHLLSHLAFKTLPEDSKVYLARAAGSFYSATRGNNLADEHGTNMEDLATDDYIKVMATRGLWRLAIANTWNCRIIAESKALMCFAFFLEKGPKEARYNSAIALTEITKVAEHNTELRRLAFKLNLPAYKAVVNQLFRVIDQAESEILVPCVKVIGNLARTFKAKEMTMINSLSKLLDAMEDEVSREACTTLAKFACSGKPLSQELSKAIINGGRVNLLVRLVYYGGQSRRRSALILLCYVSLSVPESETLAGAGVLAALHWASRNARLIDLNGVESLVAGAKALLELHQSRGYRVDL